LPQRWKNSAIAPVFGGNYLKIDDLIKIKYVGFLFFPESVSKKLAKSKFSEI
jgi:hypothetical protein